jgi:DNA-binding NtrC family response regulator
MAQQHILVVDDEEPICDLLSDFFQKRGFQVTTAGNTEQARKISDEVPINLIILDVLLPDGDGMDLLESIKASHPNLPIIIMTGIGFDEDLLREAQTKGASGFVSKTLPVEQLLMEVNRTLKFHR